MFRFVIPVLLSVIFISCNRKQEDTSMPLPAPLPIPQKGDSAGVTGDTHFFWTADLDQEDGLSMKKLFPISKDSLSVENMISRINEEYPEIQIRYKRVSHDTIFLKIDKSAYLTEQMGSTGAEAYLAAVTYNMTELDGISAVDMSFKMGEHAEPGVYTRTDFIHEMKKNR